MIKQKLKFLVLSVLLLLALPAVTQAQVLVEDGFAGAAGALPDAAKFEWDGNVTLNGAGQLSVQTLPSHFSWLRSKAGAAPGLGQTLVLQMRAYAYAEGTSPGIVYGDKQPRGLRVGTNLNNSAEFYSAARTSVGMRVRKDGVESSATYALPAGVDSMHDYQISVTTTSAVFTVDGTLAGTFTTNIPTGVLNFHVCAYYSGGGNVAVTPDSVSLSLTNNQVQDPPAISSFTPANGPVGTSVAISGTNFTGITAVRFGGVDATFTNNSALLITAIVPATAATGLITVVSTNGTAASSNNFVVQPLDFTWTTNAGAISITGYTGSGGAVTIPCVINGLPVTGIVGIAFGPEQWVNVTNVIIPNSVTSIGDFAFYYSLSLTSITIPDSVTSIGLDAFEWCYSLTSVTIGNGVTNIGSGAFWRCSGLTNVTMGSNVTSIGDGAFQYCSSLTSITIPNSVTSIGGHAFSESGLTSVTIGNSVTSIGGWAFDQCYSLTSVTIGNSVTSLGAWAFSWCYSLTNVTIPNSVTSIGIDAFYYCASLTSVTIGNSVTNIGNFAFYYCTSLTSVTIPNSVTSIGEEAFASCSSLIGVYFQGNAPSLGGSSVFSGAPTTVYYLPGATGWPTVPDLWAGRPTALWLPQAQTRDASFGVRTNRFGFNINWASGQTVVVEACTNLANPVWQSVQTNTLTDGSAYFSDPDWTNYSGCYYRLRAP